MTKAKKTKFLKAIRENKHLERYLELIPEDIQKKLNAEQIATLCAITSASFERGKEWIVGTSPSIKQSFIALPTRIRSLLLSKTSNWIYRRSA